MESPESKGNHCMILLMVQQSGSSPNDGQGLENYCGVYCYATAFATSMGRKKKEEDQAHRYSIRSSAKCSIALVLKELLKVSFAVHA